MMRIAFVSDSISRMNGGIFAVVCTLARKLAKKGVEVKLFGAADEYTVGDCQERGVEFEFTPVLFRCGVKISPSLKKKLKDFSPDFIHIHGLWNYPEIVAASLNIPYAISPHGMLGAWALKNSAFRKKMFAFLFERRIFPRARFIHSLCDFESESIAAFLPGVKVKKIPNGVELPEISESLPTRDGKKEMLYCGRLHPQKGIQNLIPAFRATVPENWRLVIAGWDQNDFQKKLNALTGGFPEIEFAGPLFGKDKSEAFRRSSVCVLPSYCEGLPIAALEAWSYRKPMIMTDFCNLPEGFRSQAAFRVEPDAERLAAGLSEFFRLPDEKLKEMGRNGYDLVKKYFSWEEIASAFMKEYQKSVDTGNMVK